MNSSKYQVATFAGGCFWCMQPPFDNLDGVISTEAGYTGGDVENPTYEMISRGDTGHYEAMRVVYDPDLVSYEKLLETFWHNIDPTQADGQFADRGSQYHTAIFYHDEQQKALALASKQALEKSGRFDSPIVTKIVRAEAFYPAEDYHQKYYLKNSAHYQLYKQGSGRAGFIEKNR
ncbi:MAG: peptide-methionine (S)-S-oxide reductase MsrA [Mariprofundaceae bacterium]|nr:peptide-methionine (S)-S-oxide reductase MsrA [Mariprofundaceae bacterium]